MNRALRSITVATAALAVTAAALTAVSTATADPTGFSWAGHAAPTPLGSVTYGSGTFVAVGTDKVATSSDGLSWTARTEPAGVQAWNGVAFGNNTFVAVGTVPGAAPGDPDAVMTSPDGITWTSRDVAGAGTNMFSDVTFGNGLFVAVQSDSGQNGIVFTSPDGITWTARNIPANPGSWVDVEYGNGVFVAVGSELNFPIIEDYFLMSSPDGVTWTSRALPAGAKTILGSLAFGNGLFVAGGQSQFLTSPDGATWTLVNTPITINLGTGTYGAGLFAFMGYDESVDPAKTLALTSPDGVTWTQRTPVNAYLWLGSTYANGVFVTVGYASDTTPTISVQTSGVPAVPSVTTTSAGVDLRPSPGYFNTVVNGVASSRVDTPVSSQTGGAVTGQFPIPTLGARAKGTWTLASQNAAGANFPPAKGMKLRVGTGQYLEYSGTSLKPGSTVSAYVGPNTTGATMTLLGSTLVAANGTFLDTAFIPTGASRGTVKLNLVGTASDGSVVSNVIGAKMRGGNAMIITYPQTKVAFSSGSKKLSKGAKLALRVSLAQADREHVLTAMVKVVYAKGKKSLGKQRGAKVQNYLENNGVTGAIEVQLTKGSAKKSNTVVSQLAMGQ